MRRSRTFDFAFMKKSRGGSALVPSCRRDRRVVGKRGVGEICWYVASVSSGFSAFSDHFSLFEPSPSFRFLPSHQFSHGQKAKKASKFNEQNVGLIMFDHSQRKRNIKVNLRFSGLGGGGRGEGGGGGREGGGGSSTLPMYKTKTSSKALNLHRRTKYNTSSFTF